MNPVFRNGPLEADDLPIKGVEKLQRGLELVVAEHGGGGVARRGAGARARQPQLALRRAAQRIAALALRACAKRPRHSTLVAGIDAPQADGTTNPR